MTCGHCAGKHDTRECHQAGKASCSNCGKKHKQWDRSCLVYQVARAAADGRRRELLEESCRIQRGHRSVVEPQNTYRRRAGPVLALPRRPGRPTGLAKAGSAAGQRPLPWAPPRVEEVGEEMEE